MFGSLTIPNVYHPSCHLVMSEKAQLTLVFVGLGPCRCRTEWHCSERAQQTHAAETGDSGALPAGGGGGPHPGHAGGPFSG